MASMLGGSRFTSNTMAVSNFVWSTLYTHSITQSDSLLEQKLTLPSRAK